ncbi:MAG TPA: response regulator [Rhodanobacteraceae bacterium]|nr:response regulator [Rhodanobacteraceae bacterium]
MQNSSPSSSASASAPSSHLLVVDDDPDIVQLIARYLSMHGFRITSAADGNAMREAIAREPVDLVLLDLGLPGEDGLELTRYLRQHWRGPIIIVTGRGESVDRVVGLELGADDYVTKPFDLRELLARVRSVLRRTSERAPASAETGAAFAFAGFRLDPRSRELRDPCGATVDLTTGEYALLKLLVEHPNRVLSRDDLMSWMHGRDAGPYDRAIDVQIGRLRRKIEADPAEPALIKSVRGAGYLFAAKVTRA